MKYRKSLFTFRRDLRLDDNTGLIRALEQSETVLPCFIFDPRQVVDNPYRSDNAILFMKESLDDLENQLCLKGGRLYCFSGQPEDVVSSIIRDESIDAVFLNRDYTPFSIDRDRVIKNICEDRAVKFISCDDLLINDPDDVQKKDGTPYTVFTPFFRKSSERPVHMPRENSLQNYYTANVPGETGFDYKRALTPSERPAVHGGREQCLRILDRLGEFRGYVDDRDYPARRTTRLSAHLKFGTCSIREAYHAVRESLGQTHELLRQLYWRDFFTYIGYHYPHVFRGPFQRKYASMEWDRDEKRFGTWCRGETGFPVVDAGMRELNETGYMHNRVRMIVSSFLTKDLHLDWRMGEEYFATKLIDYDPCVNNGNWQWAASTGCDAAPYFRVFNPWLQQMKFDPDCTYIRQWVSELARADVALINSPERDKNAIMGYPAPMVDHAKERVRSISRFRDYTG